MRDSAAGSRKGSWAASRLGAGLRASSSEMLGRWSMAIVVAAMLCILLLRPVWDVDIFWQLKLGELILARGGPVLREPFAVTHLGEPLAAVAWLGQAVFALARQIGGWSSLRVFDALCWCGGFWLIAATCRLRGASRLSVVLALSLTFFAAVPTASIRPQSFGALCFGALLALLKLDLRLWQTLVLGTGLLVLWQNLHPSVSIAVVALMAHAVTGWLVWLSDRRRKPPSAATILMPIAALSLFATPDGIHVLAVSARNAQASMAVGASEWLPLWIPANRSGAGPILVVALLALGAAVARRNRESWTDAAVMLVLLAMTVSAFRFVLFWAIATVPVIAAAGHEPMTRGRGGAWRIALAAVVVVGIATPLIRPTTFSENLPMAAVARLQATDVRGTIFTEPEFAGVLIDTGYPRWRVSLDGRYYRYSDAEWRRYGDVLAGTYGLRAVERRYRPAAFVLRPSHTTWLCAELDRPDSGWQRIWRDDGAAVWVPR